MKTLLITQARFGSTRLPGKVLKEIGGKTLLQIHLDRLAKCKEVGNILVATTDQKDDEKISALAKQLNFSVYRGSEKDVLDRFYQAAKPYQPDFIIRVTSDCPLIDPLLVDEVIKCTILHDADYGSNTLVEHFPDGQDVEVFKFKALEAAWNEATLPSEREHVTPYIRKNSSLSGGRFKSVNYPSPENFAKIRMTVDESKDFEMIKLVIENQGTDKTWKEYTDYIIKNNLMAMNAEIIRNEGYLKSIKEDGKQI
ncbi:MAG TPA: glycosyltransferase family protein [Cyclobacteriaceae bacterium]|jgi:spore coat polysaccharide biosynthesis protein SpsF (cytidylyltransferase family)|nr:glycosyltransferase family protein [Cyclobacteriaceae bacterium]